MAQLLSEEMEMLSTPPLPPSKIFKEEFQEAGWRLQVPKGKQNFLWESSALTGTWAVESFYTEGLVPPIVPQQSAKVHPAPPNTHVDGLWWGGGQFQKFSQIPQLGGESPRSREGSQRVVNYSSFLFVATKWLS